MKWHKNQALAVKNGRFSFHFLLIRPYFRDTFRKPDFEKSKYNEPTLAVNPRKSLHPVKLSAR